MMIRCFEIDDWCFGCGLLVTCYLVLMFFVLIRLERVVWLVIDSLMVLVGDWRESCFSRDFRLVC